MVESAGFGTPQVSWKHSLAYRKRLQADYGAGQTPRTGRSRALLLIPRPTNHPLLAPRSYARRLHWKNVRIHSDVLTMVGGFHRSLPLWDCKQFASFLTCHPRWNPLTPGSKAKESCNEVQWGILSKQVCWDAAWQKAKSQRTQTGGQPSQVTGSFVESSLAFELTSSSATLEQEVSSFYRKRNWGSEIQNQRGVTPPLGLSDSRVHPNHLSLQE